MFFGRDDDGALFAILSSLPVFWYLRWMKCHFVNICMIFFKPIVYFSSETFSTYCTVCSVHDFSDVWMRRRILFTYVPLMVCWWTLINTVSDNNYFILYLLWLVFRYVWLRRYIQYRSIYEHILGIKSKLKI